MTEIASDRHNRLVPEIVRTILEPTINGTESNIADAMVMTESIITGVIAFTSRYDPEAKGVLEYQRAMLEMLIENVMDRLEKIHRERHRNGD